MRELNQQPSRVIALVKNGETVEITERGRPVARVMPVPSHSDLLGRLVREGRAVAPSVADGPIPVPPVLGDPGRSVAAELAASRALERW